MAKRLRTVKEIAGRGIQNAISNAELEVSRAKVRRRNGLPPRAQLRDSVKAALDNVSSIGAWDDAQNRIRNGDQYNRVSQHNAAHWEYIYAARVACNALRGEYYFPDEGV